MTWLERDDIDARLRKEMWKMDATVRVRLISSRDAIDYDFICLVERARIDLNAFEGYYSRDALEGRRTDHEIAISADLSDRRFLTFGFQAESDTNAAAGVLASLDWLPPHVGYRPRTTREKR